MIRNVGSILGKYGKAFLVFFFLILKMSKSFFFKKEKKRTKRKERRKGTTSLWSVELIYKNKNNKQHSNRATEPLAKTQLVG